MMAEFPYTGAAILAVMGLLMFLRWRASRPWKPSPPSEASEPPGEMKRPPWAESLDRHLGPWVKLAGVWLLHAGEYLACRVQLHSIKERDFQKDIGRWPKVYRMNAPGAYLITGRHLVPSRVQTFGGWKPPVFTAVAACLALMYYRNFEPGPAAVAGAMCGFISIPLWRELVMKTGFKIRLHAYSGFNSEPVPGTCGLVWWRNGWRYRVRPGQDWQAEKALHHLAQEEAMAFADFARVNPRERQPEPVFQVSSEVWIFTGYGLRRRLPLIEFGRDPLGDRAEMLLAALYRVRDAIPQDVEKYLSEKHKQQQERLAALEEEE